MTISALTSSATSPAQATANTRTADGDYKVRSAATSQVKDADGDYKAVPKSAAAASSTGVQASLTKLTLGG